MPIVQTVTRPSTSHLPPCLVDPMAFLSVTLRHFYPAGKALSCPSSALLDDDTVEGLDCSSLTLGEACVVTCADGYTTAGHTEATLTCVFDPELQSMLLEGSAHSCELAPFDFSILMPPSTVSHDCLNTVFGESCTTNCPDGNAAISGTAASTVFDLRFRWSLGERPNASVSHLRSTDVLHWRPLAQRLFVWTRLRFWDRG